VTEIAFCTLPDGGTPEDKELVEERLAYCLEKVVSVGKAHGASIGWGEVFFPLLPSFFFFLLWWPCLYLMSLPMSMLYPC
jgi:hypothetical protein